MPGNPQARKRLIIVLDYVEDETGPGDLSDIAITAELNLEKAVGKDLEATVFSNADAAVEFLRESASVADPLKNDTASHSFYDYANEPIGGGNPYYRCVHCKRSDPEINGRLGGHETWCKYRLAKERGAPYRPYADES